MDDLEGRGGREGRLLMALSILPVDQPCIREVTYGSTDGISPIVLRFHHLSWLKRNTGVRQSPSQATIVHIYVWHVVKISVYN